MFFNELLALKMWNVSYTELDGINGSVRSLHFFLWPATEIPLCQIQPSNMDLVDIVILYIVQMLN